MIPNGIQTILDKYRMEHPGCMAYSDAGLLKLIFEKAPGLLKGIPQSEIDAVKKGSVFGSGFADNAADFGWSIEKSITSKIENNFADFRLPEGVAVDNTRMVNKHVPLHNEESEHEEPDPIDAAIIQLLYYENSDILQDTAKYRLDRKQIGRHNCKNLESAAKHLLKKQGIKPSEENIKKLARELLILNSNGNETTIDDMVRNALTNINKGTVIFVNRNFDIMKDNSFSAELKELGFPPTEENSYIYQAFHLVEKDMLDGTVDKLNDEIGKIFKNVNKKSKKQNPIDLKWKVVDALKTYKGSPLAAALLQKAEQLYSQGVDDPYEWSQVLSSECWSYKDNYGKIDKTLKDCVLNKTSTDQLKKIMISQFGINLYSEDEIAKLQDVQLQNGVANLLKSICGYMSAANENVYENGGLFTDIGNELLESWDSFVNWLGGDIATNDEYTKFLKNSSELCEYLTADKISYEEFKKIFTKLFGKEFDEKAVTDLLDFCANRPNLDVLDDIHRDNLDFLDRIEGAFGKNFRDYIKSERKRLNGGQILSMFGNMAIMITGMKMLGASSFIKGVGFNSSAYLYALGLEGTSLQLGTAMTVGASTFAAYTLAVQTVDNIIKERSLAEWDELPAQVGESALFGAFAAALNVLCIAPLTNPSVARGLKSAENLVNNASTPVSGEDFAKALYEGSQPVIQSGAGKFAYSLGVNTAGFTAYNTAADLIENGTERLKNGNASKYIGDLAYANFVNLLSFEGLQFLIGGAIVGKTGAEAAHELTAEEIPQYFESLKAVTIENYKDGYIINFPNARISVNSIQEVYSTVANLMMTEAYYKSKTVAADQAVTRYQPETTNMSAEGKALPSGSELQVYEGGKKGLVSTQNTNGSVSANPGAAEVKPAIVPFPAAPNQSGSLNTYSSVLPAKVDTKSLSPDEITQLQKKTYDVLSDMFKNCGYTETAMEYTMNRLAEKIDYSDLGKHLRNIEILSRAKISYFDLKMIMDKGYFSWKEGLEAFDFIVEKLGLDDANADAKILIDIFTQLPDMKILKIKNRNITISPEMTARDIIDLANLPDNEVSVREKSIHKSELVYVSEIEEINEIFVAIKNNNEREMKEANENEWCPRVNVDDYRKLDEIITEEIRNNPDKKAEILAFYKKMASDFDYDYNQMYVSSTESSEGGVYRKAYDYAKSNGMGNAKIVILNPECRNIYNAGNIIDSEGKQNLSEWDIAVFDYDGNFIRYQSGKVEGPKYKNIRESVESSMKGVKYSAEIIPFDKFNILIDSRKEVRGENGELLYVETYERKMAESKTKYDRGRYKYDIYREYPDGRKFKIGETTFFGNKDVLIEKSIPHDNGNLTNYVYMESPNGSKYSYTQIKGKDGKVILEHKNRFKVLGENHFRSIENGIGYDIEYTDSSVEVTRDDGTKVSIPLGDNTEAGVGVLSKDLLPLLKQMPGSFYFDINEFGLSKIALGIDDVEVNNAHYRYNKNFISMSEELKLHFFVLAHEFGHFRDEFLGISKNKEVIDIYTKERQALTESHPNFENEALNYFINIEGGKAADSLQEIVAEINALLYSSNLDERIELRSQFLQEYFPETFAKVAELLTAGIAESTGIPAKVKVNTRNVLNKTTFMSLLKPESESPIKDKTIKAPRTGILPGSRISTLFPQSSYNEMPELEQVMIELSNLISEDYGKDFFDNFVGCIYADMYVEGNKEIGNLVTEALKKGIGAENIFPILDQDWGSVEKSFYDAENAKDLVKEIKNKFIKAMIDNPDKAYRIPYLARFSEVISEDQKLLDLCIKYLDDFTDIIATSKSRGSSVVLSKIQQGAVDCIYKFDKAGLPLDAILKYTDILFKIQGNVVIIPDEVINKVVELHNNNKIDNVILNAIGHFHNQPKFNEIIDEIIRLRTENMLDDLDNNHYMFFRMLKNKENLLVYDNYKEMMDFYIKSRDVFGGAELLNIIDRYTSRIEPAGSSNFDLSGFEAAKELVTKVQIDPFNIRVMLDDTRVNRLEQIKNFVEKVDIEEFADEIRLLFSREDTRYALIGSNLSQEALTVLLTAQRLLIEVFAKGLDKQGQTSPDILERDWFAAFETKQGEKPWKQEALDRLLYYIESDLSSGQGISVWNGFNYVIDAYKRHPQYIAEIEDLIFASGDMNYFNVSTLSEDPNVVKKQLYLFNKIKALAGTSNNWYLGNRNYFIIDGSEEDLDVRIKLLNILAPRVNVMSGKGRNNALNRILLDIEHAGKANEEVIYEALKSKKYRNCIGNIATYVTEKNAKLIKKLIQQDKIKKLDDLSIIVRRTYNKESLAAFLEKNLDVFPPDDLAIIAEGADENNIDFIMRLYKEKDMSKHAVKNLYLNIAFEIRSNNAKILTDLCFDKKLNFPQEYIKDIAKAVRETSLVDLAEKLCTDKTLNCPPELVAEALYAVRAINKDIKSLNLTEKINTLSVITGMPKAVLNVIRTASGVDIDAKVAELRTSLGEKRDVIIIPKEDQKLLWQNVLSNNTPETDNVFKSFDFAKYGKKGLPLEYTRLKFTENVENILKTLKPEEQKMILDHFGLVRGAAGFDGLPNNKEFNNPKASAKVRDAAQAVKEEIEKFTAKNRIKTGDDKADEVLNSLISGLPEFTSIVGKLQHDTHAYSVDIHSLKVLQSAMNNPLYDELTDLDKTILKIAALCHDFGKSGGVVDTGHASISAEYMAAILEKFDIPQRIKDRIIDIVENHHWFEAYNTGKARAEDIAVRCRRPQDFIIYEILAKADLENVSETFHYGIIGGAKTQEEVNAYFAKKMENIDNALNLMYSKANIVFDTKFTQNGDKFPKRTVMIDGGYYTMKVLNLNEIGPNESLTKYGFASGVTKKSMRSVVHMTDPYKENLKAVYVLTRYSLNQSAWSVSLISSEHNPTYCGRDFGFILDVDQANIAEAYRNNIGSGVRKTLKDFCEIIFNSRNDEVRTFVKDHLVKELSKKGIKLNSADYIQLAKQLISLRYSTQITDDITIGSKTIKAEVLRECLEKSADALFEGYAWNELVVLNPRIIGLYARVKKLSDCPVEFLRFANEHDLPIVLMKEEDK